jgi:50S ribosomal subunit-associated GTPase HflX
VLACNKIDLLNPEDVSFWQEHLAEVLREAGEPADTPACLISAETGEGKENLIDLIAALYRTIQEEEKNSIRETNIEGQGGGE